MLELSIISKRRVNPKHLHLVFLSLSWWVILSWLSRQLLLKLINEGCIVFITLNMLSAVLLMLGGSRNSCSSSCRESLKYPRAPRSRCEGSDFLCLLTYVQRIKMNLFLLQKFLRVRLWIHPDSWQRVLNGIVSQHLSPSSSRATRCENWENPSCPHLGAGHSLRQDIYTSLPGFTRAVDTFCGKACHVFLYPLCSFPFGMRLVLVT